MSSQNFLFRFKTQEAHAWKILAELLTNNIKTACFEVDETGIKLTMMDSKRYTLINLFLSSDKFMIYRFNSPKKLFVGCNCSHLHKMVKSIKKKDSIEMYIDEKRPTDLTIKVIPKENNKITVSDIKIQNVQNLQIDLPIINMKPINVSSSDFQKLVKEMSSIGAITRLTSKQYSIQFSANAGGILKRNVSFGEYVDEEDDSEEVIQEFNTDQLSKIAKIAGLSNTMQIFPSTPLLLRSSIGTLGSIDIFLKSKEQIETEIGGGIVDSDIDSDC